MGALTKAIEAGRANTTAAFNGAMRLKAGGGLASQLSASADTGFTTFRDQAKHNQKYRLYRGWIYSIAEAVAQKAAGQPVNVGRLKAEPELERSHLAGTKSFLRSRMTQVIYSKSENRDIEILEGDPLVKVLEQPNPVQYRWQFVHTFITNLLLTGWGYIVRDEVDGVPEFWAMPTTWIEPVHKDRAFSSYKFRNPNKASVEAVELDRDHVAFAHLPNPADPIGAYSPAGSQILSIRIDDHIQTSQERYFENGIFPSVVITMGKEPFMGSDARRVITGPQRREITGAIRKMWGSTRNYGMPAIVDGLIEKIEPISATANEMGWDKSEDKVKARIFSAFGVHPFILGTEVGHGGYAQTHDIRQHFCDRVNTYLDLLSTVMTTFVGRVEEDDSLLVWWDKCEAHNPDLDSRNLNKARDRGDITEEELRAFLGYPPKEEGNSVVIKSQMVQPIANLLDKIGTGNVQPDQAEAVLTGLGISDELAKRIAAGQAKEQPSEQEVVEEATEELGEAIVALRMTPDEIAESIQKVLK